MVKQRFLMHFKPWLIAVSKAGALIVTYQLIDLIRIRLQRPPLDISDVMTAATIALLTLGLLCGLWTWGEWCCFKLRRFHWLRSDYKFAFATERSRRKFGTLRS